MVALGIDLGGTRIKIGIVEDGVVLAADALPNRSTPDDLVDVVARVRDLADGRTVDAVGIAVPGVVRPDRRGMLLAAAKYAYLQDTDLVAWAGEAFGAPAVVENDARAALVGETTAGCARGHDDVVMVVLGTGIGTAATMGGRLVRGRSGHAGILGGHQTIMIDGPRCPCGNVGCAEALAASWNVADVVARARARTADDGPVGGGDGVATSPQGVPAVPDPLVADGWRGLLASAATDPVARAATTEAARVWAAATASMVLAYDPELVVLSGGVLAAPDLVVPAVREHLDRHLWGSMPRPRLVVARDPDHSVVVGTAALAHAVAAAEPLDETPAPPRRPTPTLEH